MDYNIVWGKARWLLLPDTATLWTFYSWHLYRCYPLPVLSKVFYRNYVQDKASVLFLHVLQFESVFTKKDFDIFSNYYKWDHAIKLILGIEPKLLKIYHLFSIEQSKLDNFIAKNLYTRFIWLSNFSIAVLIFFIKKKDGFLHLIQNYRNLNLLTIRNKYLLFLISELVMKL